MALTNVLGIGISVRAFQFIMKIHTINLLSGIWISRLQSLSAPTEQPTVFLELKTNETLELVWAASGGDFLSNIRDKLEPVSFGDWNLSQDTCIHLLHCSVM